MPDRPPPRTTRTITYINGCSQIRQMDVTVVRTSADPGPPEPPAEVEPRKLRRELPRR